MKLEKYKIQKHKFGFFWLCVAFLVGLVFVMKISDFMVKTVQIEATVTKTYEAHHSTVTHTPGGPRMNIEWIDLNGEIQTEGNLANESYYEVGDTLVITVDEKTESKRIMSKSANVIMFLSGTLLCAISLYLMKMIYGRDKYYGE